MINKNEYHVVIFPFEMKDIINKLEWKYIMVSEYNNNYSSSTLHFSINEFVGNNNIVFINILIRLIIMLFYNILYNFNI